MHAHVSKVEVYVFVLQKMRVCAYACFYLEGMPVAVHIPEEHAERLDACVLMVEFE